MHKALSKAAQRIGMGKAELAKYLKDGIKAQIARLQQFIVDIDRTGLVPPGMDKALNALIALKPVPGPGQPAQPTRRRRGRMSEEGRRRISIMMKRRHAQKRKEGRTTLNVPEKSPYYKKGLGVKSRGKFGKKTGGRRKAKK
jgi:hypothetical protein